ncbi:MAG: sodium:solute symporter family protein [Chloroflexota bacterium]
MTLSAADIIVVAAYVALALYLGIFAARRKASKGVGAKEDYILAGRRLTLPFFVATLVATWYGNILGVGEFIFGSGLVAWISFGIPYYISALLFAYFFAGKIRNTGAATIPEQIASAHGRRAGFISSVVVLLITIPAAYMLMLGVMIQLFTGWSLAVSVTIGAAISLAYLYKGGFKSDVATNAAQFILMYLGFGALATFAIMHYGSPGEMISRLPAAHLSATGGLSLQYVLAWYVIAFQTFVDPSFFQRCAAATSGKTARRGVFISVGFWLLFDMLTLACGLYARAYLPGADPLLAFPALAESVMPPYFKGLLLTAIIAIIMSALSGYAFLTASTIGADILLPLSHRIAFLKRYDARQLSRFGLFVSAVLGVLLALILPSAVDLIYKTSSIAVPALLSPLMLSYSKKFVMARNRVIATIFLSAGASFFWTILKITMTNNSFVQNIEPMLPGIIVATISTLAFTKRRENENLDNS